jgi:hypothetical protein
MVPPHRRGKRVLAMSNHSSNGLVGTWSALALVGAALLAGSSCGGAITDTSGPDAYRHQAEAVELNVWIPDSVSAFDGDQTDWKAFVLDRGADVVVSVVFDNDDCEGDAALYDKYGMQVSSEFKRKSDSPRLTLQGALPAGKNFVRVSSGPKSKAGYTMQVQVAKGRYTAPE